MNKVISQSDGIGLSINDSNTGTALHINYTHKAKERITFGGGIRIHINPNLKFGNGGVFDHTFYAKSINQRVGLNAFIEYKFNLRRWKIKPFIGYHSQVLRTARKVFTRPNDTQPEEFEWDSPLTVWNNTIAFGISHDFSTRLSLKLHCGLGPSYIYNVDKRVLIPDRNPNNNNTWQANLSFNLGMVYWITSNKK